MKTPKEISKMWGLNIIGQSLIPRIEIALRNIEAKNVLDMQDFRQLNECGISVIGSLYNVLNTEQEAIYDMIKNGEISYSVISDALEKKYNGIMKGSIDIKE